MMTNNGIKTYSIGVDIVLTSPMHISALEKGRYDPATQRIMRYDNKQGGLACTLTRGWEVERLRTYTDGNGVEKQSLTDVIPTIPANTLGGRLRRRAADLITDSVLARKATLSADAFNTLAAGTARAEMKRSKATLEIIKSGKLDAYLGVFGGTGYALQSELIVDEGLPVTAGTERLLRFGPQTAEVSPEGKLTIALPIVKKDDVNDMSDIDRLEAVVGAEAVAMYVKAIADGRTGKNERKAAGDDSGKKTELTTLATIEAIKPGVNVALRFQLRSRSPAHLGLLLMCLKAMCDEGQLGGKANRGFGRFFVGSARLYSHDKTGRSIVGTTIFEKTAGGIHTFTDAPVIAEAVMAGQDYVDNVDVAFIERFSEPVDQEADDASTAEGGGEGGGGEGKKAKRPGPKPGGKGAKAVAAKGEAAAPAAAPGAAREEVPEAEAV